MKLEELPEHLKEVLALQDVLISIGYDQDQLFICPSKAGISISVYLNGKHHPFVATTVPMTNEIEFMKRWTEVIATWNASSQEDRHLLVENSAARKSAVALLATLTTLGILPDQTISFSCPFCGRHVQGDARNYSISHTVPTCEKFNELDPLAFLREARHTTDAN